MNLHQLTSISDKKAKRLGRGVGSKAGAKSGRGTTRHQKARTTIPLHFEGGQNKITKKYPLLRGKGRNKAIFAKPFTLNVEKLNKLEKGTRVDMETLVAARIVSEKAFERGVKLLGRGTLTVALTIALPASKKAQEKIVSAGGTIVTA